MRIEFYVQDEKTTKPLDMAEIPKRGDLLSDPKRGNGRLVVKDVFYAEGDGIMVETVYVPIDEEDFRDL